MDNSTPMMDDANEGEGFQDYELKEMAETLMRAEEIKQDPEKMKALEPYLNKKAKAIRSIADLRQAQKDGAAPADQADATDDMGSDDSEA